MVSTKGQGSSTAVIHSGIAKVISTMLDSPGSRAMPWWSYKDVVELLILVLHGVAGFLVAAVAAGKLGCLLGGPDNPPCGPSDFWATSIFPPLF